MSHVPAVPEPAHVSRVPRTLLDRVAQWWRTSTLTLWAVAGAAGLFQLMVLNVASYTYPHLPLRGWVIVALLLTASLVARRHWPLAVVIVTSLASGAVDLWGPRGGLNLLSMLALYALLVAAPTRDRLIGFSISALCTLVPTALAKWPQVSALTPDFLALVLVLAVASISRSRREALEHGDAQLAAQSAEQRLVAQRDAARHQARVAAELHDSVGHALTAIIALSEGMQGTGGSPQTDEAIDMMNALAREGLADTRRAVASLQAAPGPSPDDAAETTDPLTGRVTEGPQSPSGAAGWDRLNDLLTTVRATGISAALTETGRRPHRDRQAPSRRILQSGPRGGRLCRRPGGPDQCHAPRRGRHARRRLPGPRPGRHPDHRVRRRSRRSARHRRRLPGLDSGTGGGRPRAGEPGRRGR